MFKKIYYKNIGISPVIGVILLVTIVVSLVSLTTVIVFDIGSDVSDSSSSLDSVITVDETNCGINVNVIRNENVDSIKIINIDGDSKIIDN